MEANQDPSRRFVCPTCGKGFKWNHHLERHVASVHGGERLTCEICRDTFTRRDTLRRHTINKHGVVPPPPPPRAARPLSPPVQPVAHPQPQDQPPYIFEDECCPDCDEPAPELPWLVLFRHLEEDHHWTPKDLLDYQNGLVLPDHVRAQLGGGAAEPEEDGDDIPADLTTEMFTEHETGFRGRLKTYRLRQPPSEHLTIHEFMVIVFEEIASLLKQVMEHVTAIKTNIFMRCEFTNIHGETCERAFKTKNIPVLRSEDLEQVCGDLFQKLLDEKEECQMKGSGWTFARLLDMEVRVNVYYPLRGRAYVRLPVSIKNKNATINVLSFDDRCFMYAILTKFVNNPHRLQLRAHHFTDEVRTQAGLDFSGLDYPVRIDQIGIFERNNNVSVNVYGLDLVKKKGRNGGDTFQNIVYPLRIAKKELPMHFDLLFLTDDNDTHYVYITDFERLVRSQLTRHKERIFVCKRCFAYFHNTPNKLELTGEERLQEHMRYCYDHAPLRTDLPEEKYISFKRPERSQRVRFTIYADFECALVPYEAEDQLRDSPPTVPPPAWDPALKRGELPHHRHRQGTTLDSTSVTTQRIHIPYSYAYYIRDNQRSIDDGDDDDGTTFSALRIYRGEDAGKHFMSSVRDDVKRIGEILFAERQNKPRLTPQQEAEFQSAITCYICQRPFTNEDGKVRDHQHSAPYNYRGAAHRSCNLRHQEQDTVNCYFHNLSNYDAHFVVRELAIDGGEVNVLANTEEKFITFSKRFDYPNAGRHQGIRLRFVDSYRFLSKGLATLASILPVDKLKITNQHFPDHELFNLVRRKGVFPYEYITSHRVLDEEELPPKEAFRDNLRKEDVTEEDYAHARNVWNKFGCVTLGDYADIYLKTDVMLLADIFETFRDNCLQHYGLDPAHYVTLPSYAWDVMLLKTGVQLETLQDVDQYLFFEKGVRGGLAQCVTRHVVADNKIIRGDDTEKEDDEFIMYYDANNLYGWAMCQPLPYGNFNWLSREEIDALDLRSISADGDTGYILEVDLEYPKDRNLHDRHRDLPFCPEVRKAPAHLLPYPEEVRRDFNVGRSEKLMSTLMDKQNYIIHIRSLQQALDNGLRLQRIHRVMSFSQSPWLEPYVTLNTRLRQQTSIKFEQELFKLMNNAVYGMSLQNVRKHINIKIATHPDKYTKYVAKSNFSDRMWLNENLALIHMAQVRVVLDKPVYVGMTILEQSKWWMYNFHYRMVDFYGIDRIRLIYMDTDSLVYRIRTGDVYRDMLLHLEDFDTSNYPRDHICFDETNARVLGKFKDEAGGKQLEEFIGLMAKLYCMQFHGQGRGSAPPPIKRAKGVNRAVVQNGLTVDDYRRCLQDRTVKRTDNERFASIYHKVYSINVKKRSLAPYDDKRYIMTNGVETLPWGHYDIPIPPPQ